MTSRSFCTQKPEIRSAQREAAMREVKERAKEKKAAKQKAKAPQPSSRKQMKQPKGGNKNARGRKPLVISLRFSFLSACPVVLLRAGTGHCGRVAD